jgi:hypothetical protein
MKQVIIAAVLIVVVVGAGVFIWMQMTGRGKTSEGKKAAQVSFSGVKMTVMDVNTNEEITLFASEYMTYKMDPDTGYRTNPKGQVLAPQVFCDSCKAKVPQCKIPQTADSKTQHNAEFTALCPKCKNRLHTGDTPIP